VGCECWGHLDLRHGAFEVALSFRRNERPHLKIVSG
jgi:hypothetical protein